MGTLYYGDNLDILRRYLKDETVDLVCLDPPFNSAQNYNAFFHEKDGTDAASQIQAFEDTWRWNQESQKVYEGLILQPGKVSEVMQAFHTFLGTNDMMAYLAMMAPRLVELRRVLKTTGSLYLHCDPTASHYLKLLLDAVFGVKAFKAEIIWRRHNARSTEDCWPHIHDSILFYTKSDEFFFQQTKVPADERKVPHTLITGADGKKYQTYELTGPGRTQDGESGRPWRGFSPSEMGRHWANSHGTMDDWANSGLMHFPKDGGFPRRRAAEPFDPGSRVVTVGDVWTDIDRLNQTAKERLGYPTQKPVALLERILHASSPPCGLVLDPFGGCGTTIDAAEKLGRKWIGIDITQLATSLIKNRLRDTYGEKIEIITIGEPITPNEAYVLAEQDKYQFQWWALGLVGARPVEQKKGADHGIDGKILFRDDLKASKAEQVIIQVKGGKTGVKDVRDLRGVLDREKAAMGVLISLQPPTAPMEAEAASAGFYTHKMNEQQYPRLQLRTVKELMEGKGIERPSNVAAVDETFKKAPESKKKLGHQKEFGI
jgi:DNA modification methylase